MVTLLADAPPLTKGTKVRAARDLEGVPEGTAGKIKLINGMTWLRYWVQFDNGVWLGSIDHADLVPAKEWDEYLRRREAGELGTSSDGADAADGGDGPAAAADGDDLTLPNGVVVPALLVTRTKAALERLGVSR